MIHSTGPYIKSVLTKLEIAEFEADLFSLSKALFENSEQIQDISLEEKQLSLLEFLFGSGTYGTMENIVNRRLEKLDKASTDTDGKIKRRYYISRLFPDNEWYKIISRSPISTGGQSRSFLYIVFFVEYSSDEKSLKARFSPLINSSVRLRRRGASTAVWRVESEDIPETRSSSLV